MIKHLTYNQGIPYSSPGGTTTIISITLTVSDSQGFFFKNGPYLAREFYSNDGSVASTSKKLALRSCESSA